MKHAAAVFLLLIWFVVPKLPLRLNLSPSAPKALYLEHKITTVHRGDLVAVCLPTEVALWASNRGYLPTGTCPDGIQPVAKTVVAIAGDLVHLYDDALTVNGQSIAGYERIATDSGGRPMLLQPIGPSTVPAGYVWLHSGRTPRSLDSRIYGVIPQSNLTTRLELLWKLSGEGTHVE